MHFHVAPKGTCAAIQVQALPAMTATAEFTHAIIDLASDASIRLDDVWDTSGAGAGAYRILGYVTYDGQTSDPQTIMVNTRYCVYLPIVIR